jgi:hypothetical protein
MRSSSQRILGVMLAAVAFGVSMSVIKGNGPGIRDAVGNTSAPWLLLPFVAGAVTGRNRPVTAALTGTLASLVALVGFYVANTFVLDLGPHPWIVDLQLALQGGRRYLEFGLLSGPFFGALGGWWQRARSVVLGVLVASLLVFEPFAWLIYGWARHARYDEHPLVWAVEASAGLCGCVTVAVLTRRSARPTM